MEYHPVLDAPLGERNAFYRSDIYYKDGKKQIPQLKPVTTAQQAIARNLSQPWDIPGTRNPLILDRQPDILLCDCDHCVVDGVLHPLVAELEKRLNTCWDISYSGTGRHALAFTELSHLHGRKKLVIPLPDTPDGKLEIFLGCQPALITPQLDRPLPLKNCDQELQKWLEEKVAFPEKNGNKYKKRILVVIHESFFSPALFSSWLAAHDNFPGKTKRRLLEYLWNAPKYHYGNGLQRVYAPEVIKRLRLDITPQMLSQHLHDLERDGWLFREYGTYSSGLRALSVRLNVDEQFIQVGKENEQ